MPIGATIAGGAILGSAVIGSNAASDSAEAQAAAAKAGMEASQKTQMEMFNKAEGYHKPYMELGTSALPTLKSLLGLGEGGSEGMMETLRNYPGYEFATEEGRRALDAMSAGMGSRTSGNRIRAGVEYSNNLATNLFSDYYNKLSGAVNTGQNSSLALGNAAVGVGTNVGNTQMQGNTQIGNAQAAGIVGQANAWSGALDQAMSLATAYYAAPKIPGANGANSWGSFSSAFGGGGGGGNVPYYLSPN